MPVIPVDSTRDTKAAIRRVIVAARADRTAADAAEADARRDARIVRRIDQLRPAVVAAYVSTGDEPDTTTLLSELADRGVTVVLPALADGPGVAATVDWAEWTGEAFGPPIAGIPQPVGRRLGVGGLSRAEVIILPGLAGSPAGTRLGRGGGWYDRALPYAATSAPRWLVLNDEEVLPTLPAEAHDVAVTALVTDRRWIDCRQSRG